MQLYKLTEVRKKLDLSEPAARQYLDQLDVAFAPLDPKGDARKVGVSSRAYLALALVAVMRKRHADVPLCLALHAASAVFEGAGERLRGALFVKRSAGGRSWWAFHDSRPAYLANVSTASELRLAELVEDAAAVAGLDARVAYPKFAEEPAA